MASPEVTAGAAINDLKLLDGEEKISQIRMVSPEVAAGPAINDVIQLDGEDGDQPSESTMKQIKYGLSIFDSFCQQAEIKYEDFDNEALDLLLSQFYAGARKKKGALYSKKSMMAIRFGLQRHFLATRDVDVIKGRQFALARRTFNALMVKLKEHGKATVNHHPSMTAADMHLIQASLPLSNAKGLQQKVFVDLMVYFGNGGMDNLRNLKPKDFILHPASGSMPEFVSLRFKAGAKGPQDGTRNCSSGRMVAIPGNPRCPVANLKKYKSRLNPLCEWMWQRPKRNVCEGNYVWYDNAPLGRDTLSEMTKKISQAAGCSKTYTNHCLRATCASMLHHAAFPTRNVYALPVACDPHRTFAAMNDPDQKTNNLTPWNEIDICGPVGSSEPAVGILDATPCAVEGETNEISAWIESDPDSDVDQPEGSASDLSMEEEMGWEMNEESGCPPRGEGGPRTAQRWLACDSASPDGVPLGEAALGLHPRSLKRDSGACDEAPCPPKRHRTGADDYRFLQSSQRHETASTFPTPDIKEEERAVASSVACQQNGRNNGPHTHGKDVLGQKQTTVRVCEPNNVPVCAMEQQCINSDSCVLGRGADEVAPPLRNRIVQNKAAGHCFTCISDLRPYDCERMRLQAVRNGVKLLHALRMMSWPGLFSTDCGYRDSYCCGDCVQMIYEYIKTINRLYNLKGQWMQRTGHNPTPSLVNVSSPTQPGRERAVPRINPVRGRDRGGHGRRSTRHPSAPFKERERRESPQDPRGGFCSDSDAGTDDMLNYSDDEPTASPPSVANPQPREKGLEENLHRKEQLGLSTTQTTGTEKDQITITIKEEPADYHDDQNVGSSLHVLGL